MTDRTAPHPLFSVPMNPPSNPMLTTMNTTLRSVVPSFALALGVLAFALPNPLAAQTSVYYQEDFSGQTGNQAFSIYGWSAHAGSLASDRSTNTFTGSNDGQFVSSGTGPDSTVGFGAKTFAGNDANPGRTAIEWTAEFTPVSIDLVSSISFQTKNGNTTDVQRVAIRIDTFWYVSAETFASASTTVWNQHTLTFTTDASAWLNLDFVPSSSLAEGVVLTSDLPSGNLTAIGLFNPTHTNTYRFDDVTLTTLTIPEPSTFAALGGSTALVCALFLRRRRTV